MMVLPCMKNLTANGGLQQQQQEREITTRNEKIEKDHRKLIISTHESAFPRL